MNHGSWKKRGSHYSILNMVTCFSSKYLILLWMFFAPLWFGLFSYPANAQSSGTIRIGFSSSILENVNKNDALAAIRIWAMSFVEEHDITLTTQPMVLYGIDEVRAALNSNLLDYVSLTVEEFVQVREFAASDTVTLGVVDGSITEAYILVVPEDSGIEKINDLRGQNLNILSGARASLAKIWLETLLLREGLRPDAAFFNSINSNNDIQKVILPVFFGKAAACVVTHKGFETMAELNPQIKRKLKIIAISKPMVPSVFFFTTHIDESIRARAAEGITQWHSTPAGRQCLTIFRTDRIEEHSIGSLDTSLELITEHNQLLEKHALGQSGEGLTGNNEANPKL